MKYLMAGVLMLVGACGGTSAASTTTDGAPPATPSTAPTTSSIVTTTASAPPQTGSDGDGVEFQASPDLAPPEGLAGGDGAAGSGCAPGEGPLPDGVWFGVVDEPESGAVMFDLACFFSGEAANEAAAQDGVEEIPVPNDYYIRNDNAELRLVPVATGAAVHTIGATIEDGFETLTFEEWMEAAPGYVSCPGESCLTWLYVNDGQVTEIVEQYTP